MLLQVFLATWKETQVAVKLLAQAGDSVGERSSSVEGRLSLSNPMLANLQKVRLLGCLFLN